ncbi:MAG: GtrA family protein [Candidatus Heimdallarchaeota archaeon]|nr:GtrA family protein [Candidatus Heimdallarchaeota archaeon]
MFSDREDLIELIKFMIIGASGVAVNFFILFLSLLIFPEFISVALAIYVSMTTNYILNRIWTFKSTNPIFQEYVKYLIAVSVGGLVQYLVTLGLDWLLLIMGFHQLDFMILIPRIYIANAIGIGVGFVLNFLFSKGMVFTEITET